MERKRYTCKRCHKRVTAWVGSVVYKERLCAKCLDEAGLGIPMPRIRNPKHKYAVSVRKTSWSKPIEIEVEAKDKASAERQLKRWRVYSEVKARRIDNPFEPWVCKNCGAKIYSSIKPRLCPRCGKPWREKNPTRREAAIAKYRRLESMLEATASKRRIDTIIRELSRLEMKYGMTREEVHGRWKSGSPELDKAIELSEKMKREKNPENYKLKLPKKTYRVGEAKRREELKPLATMAIVGGVGLLIAWLMRKKE